MSIFLSHLMVLWTSDSPSKSSRASCSQGSPVKVSSALRELSLRNDELVTTSVAISSSVSSLAVLSLLFVFLLGLKRMAQDALQEKAPEALHPKMSNGGCTNGQCLCDASPSAIKCAGQRGQREKPCPS